MASFSKHRKHRYVGNVLDVQNGLKVRNLAEKHMSY